MNTQVILFKIKKELKNVILTKENKVYEELELSELDQLYTLAKSIDVFKAHKNVKWDKVFGLEITASLHDVLGKYREAGLVVLEKELAKKKGDYSGQLDLLDKAKKMSLFREHRNNTFFAGAWGRTGAIKTIEKLIERVQEAQKVKEPETGYISFSSLT